MAPKLVIPTVIFTLIHCDLVSTCFVTKYHFIKMSESINPVSGIDASLELSTPCYLSIFNNKVTSLRNLSPNSEFTSQFFSFLQ